jgi:superfamily I DNA/RNA helicase
LDELVSLLLDRLEEAPPHQLRRALQQSAPLRRAFSAAWPMLDPAGVVADLFTSAAYLRRSAPWLTDDEVGLLQRSDPRAWTTADLPLLDAARQRIGDPEASRTRRRRAAQLELQREQMSAVVEQLIASMEHDDGEGTLSMLRQEAMHDALVDEAGIPDLTPDELAGPFAHIVVDEAQELTDAEWQMLLSRCPSRSFTIVGDRAQARNGFAESWEQRLNRIGVAQVRVAGLTINYRTPEEVMAEAEPVIRAALPDANVPVSIRSSGIPVRRGSRDELEPILAEWRAAHDDGVACVIGEPQYTGDPRIRSLAPEEAKGLEFDLVVLVEPERWSAVDRYVAMTRATQQLVLLS